MPRNPNSPPSPAAPPPSNQAGTSLDPTRVEYPKIIPIFREPDNPADLIVPKATPIPDPCEIEIPFQIPRGQHGPFIWQGIYLMLAVLGTEDEAPDYPLIWADPDHGVFSDEVGTLSGPPPFIGAEEGYNFTCVFDFAGDHIFRTHVIQRNDWRVMSVHQGLPAGQAGKLTIIRNKCDRFAPDTTVYLFAGLFGRMVYTFPPPYPVDSTTEPIRIVSEITGPLVCPGGTGPGVFGQPNISNIPLRRRHPSIVDTLLYSGQQHLYTRIGWQGGIRLNDDYIPARLFHRSRGGRLAAPMLVVGGTNVEVELLQPLVLDVEQGDAIGAFEIEGGSYGL